MATEVNNFYFLNLYVGYRFGKAIDISEAARAQKRSLGERWNDYRRSRAILKEQKQAEKNQDRF